MKKIGKFLRILSLVLALSAIVAVFSLPQAEEYSVPTLYIDNRAWYMYSLFPLTEQNGAYLVPSSLFGAVDGVEISTDEARSCLLFQYGENFISVNTKTQNALLHTGQVKKISVSQINDEYFVDSQICAQALGFSVEVAEFEQKNVLRIKTQEDLLDLKTLVERNRVLSESTNSDGSDTFDSTPTRRERNLVFCADFTEMSAEEQSSFTDFLSENKLSASIIMKKDNLTSPELLNNIIRVNALGCSFIIQAKNTPEISECNALLRTILRNGTRLVSSPDNLKLALDSIGYILCETENAKLTSNPNSHEFEKLTVIEITDFNDNIKSNLQKWTAAANQKDVFIRALCPATGN